MENVDKIIDKAAVVAKEKVGEMIAGDKKKAGGTQQGQGGIGGMLSGALGKAGAEGNKASEQALAFGKGLIK